MTNGYYSLIFDEIKKSKQFIWTKRATSLSVLGSRCSKDEEASEETEKQSEELADHALVFMIRPYRKDWVQPFGVFASKYAAPGKGLSRLLIKAFILLALSARVINECCFTYIYIHTKKAG